ncbi:MAG TPA: rhomboid family intramembrane serine protease [Kineosporiaceae bacterium]|nr:rhomboid family intramembrane serine protease [Kineosporiaceae bacterium]
MSQFPTGGGALDPAGAVPVCPRHPGRESYVRCQRCERPVCPECQRPAAVGIQCVDCVREQAKTVRTARTVFGGRVAIGPPLVTQSIIGICVAVFALQWFGGDRITNELSFFPPEALAQPYRFLTSAFVHSPTFIFHILMNMYALWILGPYLEQLLGRARFAALYLLAAVGGSVGYFVIVPASPEPGSAWLSGAVGASGAIFGLFSALVIVNRRLGRDIGGVVGVIVINAVLGFLPGLNIAWQAHLGGLITGVLVTAVLASPSASGPASRSPRFQLAGLVGIAVLLVALVAVKTALLPEGVLV